MKLTNKTNSIKLGAMFLVVGAAFSNASCTNNAKLFLTVSGKDLEVEFCDRGASIYSIKYKDQYVTYHPKDKATFLKNDYYYGKALGRVAGRIKDGKLSVDGQDYTLEVNETSGKKHNSLHGGTNGFVAKDFTRTVEETNECTKVSFTYTSKDLEAGFPGEVKATYEYKVYKNISNIDLNITATTNKKTPLNLSLHPYFRLGNTGDILGHKLEIPTDTMAQYDAKAEDQTVIGEQSVKTSGLEAWDFNKEGGKCIGQDIDTARAKDAVSGGYDHIWKFTDDTKKYVNLYNPATKINLKVNSDADAVILYANCYPHTSDVMNPSGNDSLYSGITIEPYKFFTRDSVNDLLIDKNQQFNRSITYAFSEKQ